MYVRLLEQLERQVLADRQVMATLIAGQVTKARELPPSWAEVREQFDAALLAEPSAVSAHDYELRRELGVA